MANAKSFAIVVVAFLLAILLIPQFSASETADELADTQWIKYGSSPVIHTGLPGSWDSLHVVVDCVIKANGAYHLYYAGSSDGQVWNEGHAISSDCVHWMKDQANPIMAYAHEFMVIHEDGLFKAWYTDSSTYPWPIRCVVSPDGSTWQQGWTGPVLSAGPSNWDSGTIRAGPVLHNSTGYSMWYSATSDGMTWSIGLATSLDGINWTKHSGNPVIEYDTSIEWRSVRVFALSVLETPSGLVMWYFGSNLQVQRLGSATSTDGRIWQLSAQPVLDIGPPENWDSLSLSFSSVIQDEGKLIMLYSGTDQTYGYNIGLATSTPLDFAVHDSGKDYSILVPPGWTITDDETVAGKQTESLIQGPTGYGIQTNVIVLTGTDASMVDTHEYLQDQVHAAEIALEQSLGIDVTITGALRFQEISNHSAVVFGLDYSGYDLHQEGAIIIDPGHSRYWTITCTESKQARMQFDPIFDVIIGDFSIDAPNSPPQMDFFFIVVVGVAIGGAAILVMAMVLLRSKRNRI